MADNITPKGINPDDRVDIIYYLSDIKSNDEATNQIAGEVYWGFENAEYFEVMEYRFHKQDDLGNKYIKYTDEQKAIVEFMSM